MGHLAFGFTFPWSNRLEKQAPWLRLAAFFGHSQKFDDKNVRKREKCVRTESPAPRDGAVGQGARGSATIVHDFLRRTGQGETISMAVLLEENGFC
jgi:hypothetical protein